MFHGDLVNNYFIAKQLQLSSANAHRGEIELKTFSSIFFPTLFYDTYRHRRQIVRVSRQRRCCSSGCESLLLCRCVSIDSSYNTFDGYSICLFTRIDIANFGARVLACYAFHAWIQLSDSRSSGQSVSIINNYTRHIVNQKPDYT